MKLKERSKKKSYVNTDKEIRRRREMESDDDEEEEEEKEEEEEQRTSRDKEGRSCRKEIQAMFKLSRD